VLDVTAQKYTVTDRYEINFVYFGWFYLCMGFVAITINIAKAYK